MFDKIQVPADCVMLFNLIKLKPGVSQDDLEMLVGEMCNVVKETYGTEQGGFIAGQVMRFAGFVSPQGSVNADKTTEDHYAIVTYWKSFAQHETSHADQLFLAKFQAVADQCSETKELGYEILWQGAPETA